MILFFISLNLGWEYLGKYFIFLAFLLYQNFVKGKYDSSIKKSREETLNYKKIKQDLKLEEILKSPKKILRSNRIILSEVLLGLILVIFNLFLLSQSYPFLLFLIVLWIDVTCLVFITHIAANLNINPPVKIKLNSGKLLNNVRVIEYLSHLDSIKIEYKRKVKILPREKVDFVEVES